MFRNLAYYISLFHYISVSWLSCLAYCLLLFFCTSGYRSYSSGLKGGRVCSGSQRGNGYSRRMGLARVGVRVVYSAGYYGRS